MPRALTHLANLSFILPFPRIPLQGLLAGEMSYMENLRSTLVVTLPVKMQGNASVTLATKTDLIISIMLRVAPASGIKGGNKGDFCPLRRPQGGKTGNIKILARNFVSFGGQSWSLPGWAP